MMRADYTWRPVERFPETIKGVKAWGYRIPTTREEFENEQPMDFPGYPKLSEAQDAPQNNRQRNLEMDALHYVWCDGDYMAVHRWSEGEITQAIVDLAKHNTARLEAWFERQSK